MSREARRCSTPSLAVMKPCMIVRWYICVFSGPASQPILTMACGRHVYLSRRNMTVVQAWDIQRDHLKAVMDISEQFRSVFMLYHYHAALPYQDVHGHQQTIYSGQSFSHSMLSHSKTTVIDITTITSQLLHSTSSRGIVICSYIIKWGWSSWGPQREAGDVWCLPPVWNLTAVIWFHFAISSLVLLPSPVTFSVLLFSACWPFLLNFFQKILQYFSLRDRLFCMAPV